MNRKLKAGAIAVIAIGALTSYASPYWTIYQMRSAIDARDTDKFSRYVDYPALRESLKAQILISFQGQMQSAEMKDNPFAGLGQMLGLAMVNTVVDTVVSPAGVMALMAGETPAQKRSPSTPAPNAPKEDAAKDALKYDISYRGWDLVQATARKENGEQIVADLRRDGLWSWKWVGVKLPEFSRGD